MKVVILAAGMGKRFRRIDLPKALTQLGNGQSILDLQLKALSEFTSLDNVILVVGYRKEKVMEQYPNLLYVYNPYFAEENTSKSLLRALQKVDDHLLWLNGDVVFNKKILKGLLINPNKNGMIVNVGPVSDEEVKYRIDSRGKILEISKEVKNSQGEALGINYFRAKDLDLLRHHLSQCADQDYFEKGIEMCIADKITVWSVPVSPTDCTEIDFPEDLDRANQLIKKW
jgi:L-glutamine-phosphate cytidylyltransferase